MVTDWFLVRFFDETLMLNQAVLASLGIRVIRRKRSYILSPFFEQGPPRAAVQMYDYLVIDPHLPLIEYSLPHWLGVLTCPQVIQLMWFMYGLCAIFVGFWDSKGEWWLHCFFSSMWHGFPLCTETYPRNRFAAYSDGQEIHDLFMVHSSRSLYGCCVNVW